MNRHDIPIILTAFGTTEKAFSTYRTMNTVFRQAFPHNPIHWAYSSRMVKHTLKHRKNRHLKDPLEMAKDLAAKGHPWVVLQSVHMICGHEFDRLVQERSLVNIRSAVGLPLLTSHEDYEQVNRALAPLFPRDPDTAVVLVGHGTDHPAWTAYPALEAVLRNTHGPRIFVGVVEEFPGLEYTLDRIREQGYTNACLIPLMLVAGVHFKEDLTQEEDSWQKTLERHGITVFVIDQGIGCLEAVAEIFCRHIADALDVIPL